MQKHERRPVGAVEAGVAPDENVLAQAPRADESALRAAAWSVGFAGHAPTVGEAPARRGRAWHAGRIAAMTTRTADFSLRAAERRDVDAIVALIRGLAEFEKLTHLLEVTADKLAVHLFGPKPVVEAIVAERSGRVVGFALFFVSFSTFLAKPGLWLEDLFVEPEQRGSGIGQALLEHLARVAAQRGYGRFEWSVLDWNSGAIRFYERMGATVMPDWRICRIAGPALDAYRDGA